jgi:hypothetical protein
MFPKKVGCLSVNYMMLIKCEGKVVPVLKQLSTAP